MQPVDGSDVWKTTLILPPNSTFTYKFRNGYFPDTWSGGWETISDECGVGQYNDRSISLGQSDTTLSIVCFSECLECN